MIGICIVFVFSDDVGAFLARTCLEQIANCTRAPYRIYACAPRATAEQTTFLESHDLTIVPAAAHESPSPTAEHATLLDLMVNRAFDDGCRSVATFDMDSWPVMRGWDACYSALLSEQAPVAAIVRTELGDNFPFPAFTLIAASFWRKGHSSFRSDPAQPLSRRPRETGGGILDQLAREEKRFFRLERTNDWNVHPVMAALYDDVFFHFGAGSRRPRFVTDDAHYSLNGSAFRRQFATSMNEAARNTIVEALQTDYHDFIGELAGSRLRRFEPILTEARNIPKGLVLTPVAKRHMLSSPDEGFFSL